MCLGQSHGDTDQSVHPQPEFPKVLSWVYILRDIFEIICYQKELGEVSVQSYLCDSTAWTSLHK